MIIRLYMYNHKHIKHKFFNCQKTNFCLCPQTCNHYQDIDNVIVQFVDKISATHTLWYSTRILSIIKYSLMHVKNVGNCFLIGVIEIDTGLHAKSCQHHLNGRVSFVFVRLLVFGSSWIGFCGITLLFSREDEDNNTAVTGQSVGRWGTSVEGSNVLLSNMFCLLAAIRCQWMKWMQV